MSASPSRRAMSLPLVNGEQRPRPILSVYGKEPIPLAKARESLVLPSLFRVEWPEPSVTPPKSCVPTPVFSEFPLPLANAEECPVPLGEAEECSLPSVQAGECHTRLPRGSAWLPTDLMRSGIPTPHSDLEDVAWTKEPVYPPPLDSLASELLVDILMDAVACYQTVNGTSIQEAL
ncbi:hypothetical protein CPB86DRAFT_259327 [Serendipita vermifera]|nr:hypothetical protein CPB86DRAFT_259327 [Serendipita vermifera]